MNRQNTLPILLLLIAMFSSSLPAETSPTPEPQPETGLEGVLLVSPTHGGPVRPGVPSSKPLANADCVVENDKGPVTSFKTDEQGQFRIFLTPGHYTVSVPSRKSRFGSCGPFAVDVLSGQMTQVKWYCDTGMR